MALSDAIKSKTARALRVPLPIYRACNSCHAAAEVSFITIQFRRSRHSAINYQP